MCAGALFVICCAVLNVAIFTTRCLLWTAVCSDLDCKKVTVLQFNFLQYKTHECHHAERNGLCVLVSGYYTTVRGVTAVYITLYTTPGDNFTVEIARLSNNRSRRDLSSYTTVSLTLFTEVP